MRRWAILLVLTATAAAGPDVNLPDGCVVVNSFDFAALRETEVWSRVRGPIEEFLKESMGLEGLFEGMGFDPERDLATLTFALGGDIPKNQQQVYAIARGTFDGKKLAEALKPAGIEPVERDGMTVFESKELQGKRFCGFNGAFGVADGVLLFADPAKGLDALFAATREGAPRSALSKALAAAPDAHAWTVFLPTKALKDELAKEPEGAPFAALNSGVVAYRLGREIEVALRGEAESEDLAKQVAVVVQAGLLGLGLKQRAKLDLKGAVLEGSLKVPLEDAMALMGMGLASEEEPGTSARPVVAGGAPKIEGAGRLQRLALPGQVNKLAVSPDGTHVFVDRAQESDVVLDAELRVVGKVRDAWGRMAFTPDGKLGLWPHVPGRKTEIRTIPDLKLARTVERPPGAFEPWAVCALRDGSGFAVAGWKEVRLFHMDPPRWGEAGKPFFDRSTAGAVDGKTGLLVLTGNGTWLELFDPGSLESVATLNLPHRVTYDVAATGGRAYVATATGVIVAVDIEARRLLDPVRVGAGDVSLSLSGSGKVLVAVAERFDDPDHHPTRAVVYEVGEGGLREIASAEFVGECAWNDVAVVEASRAVILGGSESLVWRYAEKSD